MSNVSKLVPVSVGMVAANKPLKSDVIEVLLLEDFPMTDGEVTDNAEENIHKSQDAAGNAYQTTAKTTLTVKATWLPIGDSNRITSPDVRRGERVDVFKFADDDKYYWGTRGVNSKLRKLETVVWAFSATKNESDDLTPDTFYYVEMSTHQKHIHIHTTTANGEPFAYDLQLNTDKGFLSFQDDIGNSFTMDSQAHELIMKNTDGSFIDINAENITAHAVQNMDFTAGGNISFKADGNISSEAGGNVSSKAGGNTSITSSGSNSIKGGSNTVDGNTTINSNLTVGGATSMNNGMSVKGKSSLGGGGTFSGDLTGTGNVSTTGSVHGNNI